mmetsp:Transcript_29715/g.69434  ORF Transcript_29715/g.69434 Transcript_29715/m.69434 type:complete len:319 (-) Transcript_29715:292-1248(-)
MPLTAGKVQRSPRVIVSFVRVNPVGQKPHNCFLVAHACSLTQFNSRLSTGELNLVHELLGSVVSIFTHQGLGFGLFELLRCGFGHVRVPMTKDSRSLIVFPPHSVVERRVLEYVLGGGISIVPKEKPHRFCVSLRSSNVQRSALEGVRVIWSLARTQQLLQVVNIASCGPSAKNVNGVCPPPLAQRCHSGLETSPDHHIELLALLRYAVVFHRSSFLFCVSLLRRSPLARRGNTAGLALGLVRCSVTKTLEQLHGAVCNDLLFLGIHLEQIRQPVSREAKNDTAVRLAGPGALPVPHLEEEGHVGTRLASPQRLCDLL